LISLAEEARVTASQKPLLVIAHRNSSVKLRSDCRRDTLGAKSVRSSEEQRGTNMRLVKGEG
jgi:hypothetical protein